MHWDEGYVERQMKLQALSMDLAVELNSGGRPSPPNLVDREPRRHRVQHQGQRVIGGRGRVLESHRVVAMEEDQRWLL